MSRSPTLRSPRVYHRGAWSRFIEGLRYGGGVGQWAWLIHRVTGLGILLFLVIHIVNTFLVVAFPAEYRFHGGHLRRCVRRHLLLVAPLGFSCR